jgi:hypothetical protein
VGEHVVERATRKIGVFNIRIDQSLERTEDLPHYLHFSYQVEVHLLRLGISVRL